MSNREDSLLTIEALVYKKIEQLLESSISYHSDYVEVHYDGEEGLIELLERYAALIERIKGVSPFTTKDIPEIDISSLLNQYIIPFTDDTVEAISLDEVVNNLMPEGDTI